MSLKKISLGFRQYKNLAFQSLASIQSQLYFGAMNIQKIVLMYCSHKNGYYIKMSQAFQLIVLGDYSLTVMKK